MRQFRSYQVWCVKGGLPQFQTPGGEPLQGLATVLNEHCRYFFWLRKKDRNLYLSVKNDSGRKKNANLVKVARDMMSVILGMPDEYQSPHHFRNIENAIFSIFLNPPPDTGRNAF
jgi:hypothetical protein